jgi:hypothetical protein
VVSDPFPEAGGIAVHVTTVGAKLRRVNAPWAVNCKQCSFVITLAETPNRLEIERARAAPGGFRAFCPACKTELEYQRADVMVWSGPPPTPAFIAHPAFVKIREP